MSNVRQSPAAQQRVSERSKATKGRQSERRMARAAKRQQHWIAEQAYISLMTEHEGTR